MAPGDAVWLEGSVYREDRDAHGGQGEATSPVVRPVHRVHDESIERGMLAEADLAGFLRQQNAAVHTLCHRTAEDRIYHDVEPLLGVPLGVRSHGEVRKHGLVM